MLVLALQAGPAAAVEVNVVGLFPRKAVVQIDGGSPRTLSVGQKTPEGVTLLSVARSDAVFDIQGRRVTLKLGQHQTSGSAPSGASVVLTADARGHFIAEGQINGLPIRLVVDTGATLISIPVNEAKRLALDYRKGIPAVISTANGPAPAYRLKLDTVRVGAVTLNSIDAVVIEGASLPFALLGMSFLNRMEMRQEGQTMTLVKRY